jgi:hypothetical protein
MSFYPGDGELNLVPTAQWIQRPETKRKILIEYLKQASAFYYSQIEFKNL